MGRKLSFLASAEEMVGERHDGPSLQEARADADAKFQPPPTGQPGIPEHYFYDPEYAAKQRAEELLNMDVVRSHSPAGRFQIDPAVEALSPYRHRFVSPDYRDRRPGGMDGWEPVPASEFKFAKELCHGHSALKVGEDGKIGMGTCFLARIPKDEAEKRTALNYQRSQRMLRAAQRGGAQLTGPDGQPLAQPGMSLDKLHRAYQTEGDPGVTSEVSLKEIKERG